MHISSTPTSQTDWQNSEIILQSTPGPSFTQTTDHCADQSSCGRSTTAVLRRPERQNSCTVSATAKNSHTTSAGEKVKTGSESQHREIFDGTTRLVPDGWWQGWTGGRGEWRKQIIIVQRPPPVQNLNWKFYIKQWIQHQPFFMILSFSFWKKRDSTEH